MLDWRTFALAAVAFAATFAGGWWFGVGKTGSAIVLPIAKAAASAPVQEWPEGPGLTTNNKIRQDVLLRSKAYLHPICQSHSRTAYVAAATNYAELLMRAAGCGGFPQCAMTEVQLDRVWRARRSILDKPVAEAMSEVHRAGGLTVLSFRGDISRAVRVIAGTYLRGGRPPRCRDPEAVGSTRHDVRLPQ